MNNQEILIDRIHSTIRKNPAFLKVAVFKTKLTENKRTKKQLVD